MICSSSADLTVDNMVNLLVQDMSEYTADTVSDDGVVTNVSSTDDNVQLWVS